MNDYLLDENRILKAALQKVIANAPQGDSQPNNPIAYSYWVAGKVAADALKLIDARQEYRQYCDENTYYGKSWQQHIEYAKTLQRLADAAGMNSDEQLHRGQRVELANDVTYTKGKELITFPKGTSGILTDFGTQSDGTHLILIIQDNGQGFWVKTSDIL